MGSIRSLNRNVVRQQVKKENLGNHMERKRRFRRLWRSRSEVDNESD